MAELVTMYPAQANTPETTLAGSLTTTGTSVTVLDGSVLPEAPNYLTIGADSATAETVLMTAKDGNDLTITRGQNGTAARAWGKGDIIGRYFTAADHDALRENIETLNTEKPDKVASPVDGNFVAFDGTTGAQKDSGKKAADFAAANHTHDGKADKVSGATSGNFAGLDESGNLTDSGKKPGDFAAANHTHDGKADKVQGATAGNLAGLDGNGNLTDSGKKASDFAAATHSHTGYAEVKIFTDVSVPASAWGNDSTYGAYPFAATITAAGVTATHVPEVNYGATEAASGDFAPVATSGSGTVKIYAAVKPTAAITIPSIICIKAV